MDVHISKRNTKLERISNINLTPCVSCASNLPCYKKCYAMKAYRQYPKVRIAWDNNTRLAKEEPVKFFGQVNEYVYKKKPEYFRWHSAGEILNQSYLITMNGVALLNSNTNFLCFTKRHDLDYSHTPKNLSIVFSYWPSWGNVNPNHPSAFVQDGTEKRVKNTDFTCPGSCKSCKFCWHIKETNQAVVFNMH